MSQEDVYIVLKENPNKWLTSGQIYELIKKKGKHVGKCTIIQNITKLNKTKFIERKPNPKTGPQGRGYVYKFIKDGGSL